MILTSKNGSIVVERLKGSLRTTQAVTEHRGEPLLNEHRALREWRQQRRDDGSDFLFISQKGGRLDRSQFFRLFQAIASEAGLPAEKQHPHALIMLVDDVGVRIIIVSLLNASEKIWKVIIAGADRSTYQTQLLFEAGQCGRREIAGG